MKAFFFLFVYVYNVYVADDLPDDVGVPSVLGLQCAVDYVKKSIDMVCWTKN